MMPMGSAFDSFNRSPLGAFIESPLGARGAPVGELVAIGTFTLSGSTVIDRLAVYDKDGDSWSELGGGIGGQGRDGLGNFQDELIIYGNSINNVGDPSVSVTNIAKFDGKVFTALGYGDVSAFSLGWRGVGFWVDKKYIQVPRSRVALKIVRRVKA